MSTPQKVMNAITPFQEPAKAPVPSRSPFEQLPTEMRIMIFKELLTSDSPLDLSHIEWETVKTNWQRFRDLARQASRLILVNKMISVEAAEVLYGSNEFYFTNHHGWRILDAFLLTIGDTNARFIKRITVYAPFLSFGCLTFPIDLSNAHWIQRQWGLVAPVYDADLVPAWMGTFDAYCRNQKAIMVQSVCRRLARLQNLCKLRLLFLVDCLAADGAFDYLTDTLVCDHDCDNADPQHVRDWHQDRFFWNELDNLRSSTADLDVGFVLVHQIRRGRSDTFEHVYSDRLMAEMYVWLFYRARAKGYRVGYGYDVLDSDDVDTFDLRNERNPNVLEPVRPRWRFPDHTSRYAQPRGEPPEEEFRAHLRAGFIFNDDDVDMGEHGPLAFRRRLDT